MRERILEGATRAFGRRGYARTRVEDVISEAGVARPSFYKEFESVDAVFVELGRTHFREILRAIEEALAATDDPGAKLEAVIDTFLRWRAELGPLGRALEAEARSPASRLERVRRPVRERLNETLREELVALGRADVDPLLFDAIFAAAESLGDSLPEAPTDADLARRRTILLRLTLGALVTPGEAEALPPAPPPPTKTKRERTGTRRVP